MKCYRWREADNTGIFYSRTISFIHFHIPFCSYTPFFPDSSGSRITRRSEACPRRRPCWYTASFRFASKLCSYRGRRLARCTASSASRASFAPTGDGVLPDAPRRLLREQALLLQGAASCPMHRVVWFASKLCSYRSAVFFRSWFSAACSAADPLARMCLSCRSICCNDGVASGRFRCSGRISSPVLTNSAK
ncbi:hypothetical protein FBY12_3737 [Pseudomonas sp. SJZ131]|nr:hypothetical protein FBY12_3737 [Pseudomonas sp. SJZ131]